MSVEIQNLAVMLREKSSSLSSMPHPMTKELFEKIIQIVNVYYACRIEGHKISAVEVEKALKGNYSRQKSKRLVQYEAAAYIETENEADERISNETDLNICSFEFISWLHRKIFEKLPEEFRKVRNREGKIIFVIPGELREEDITDVRPSFPKAKQLRKLLFKFEKDFNPDQFGLIDSLIGCAEAYRELRRMHPFLAGNGMVLRLFVKAYFKVSQLNGISLFSFNRSEHHNSLNSEKMLQSDESLNDFVSFFLKAITNEIESMSRLFSPEYALKSINDYTEKLVKSNELKKESKLILKIVFLSGELKRGEALMLTGRPERTARRILVELLEKKFLIHDTPKGKLRINFPIKSVNEIFKELF